MPARPRMESSLLPVVTRSPRRCSARSWRFASERLPSFAIPLTAPPVRLVAIPLEESKRFALHGASGWPLPDTCKAVQNIALQGFATLCGSAIHLLFFHAAQTFAHPSRQLLPKLPVR